MPGSFSISRDGSFQDLGLEKWRHTHTHNSFTWQDLMQKYDKVKYDEIVRDDWRNSSSRLDNKFIFQNKSPGVVLEKKNHVPSITMASSYPFSLQRPLLPVAQSLIVWTAQVLPTCPVSRILQNARGRESRSDSRRLMLKSNLLLQHFKLQNIDDH